MKKTILLLLLSLTFNHALAQYSKKYIAFTKNLKPIDSSTVVKKYKNGNIRNTYKGLIYLINDYEYTVPYGKEQMFRKDGALVYERHFDRYGSELLIQYFNKSGKIYFTAETESIDIKSNSIKEFFNSHKNQVSIILEKEYFIVEENGEEKAVLWRMGKRRNGKKIGVWKIYNACGKLRKEKKYRD